jgi:hypothetical protein
MTPRSIKYAPAVFFLLAFPIGAFAQNPMDQDADGLPDQFEQQLLERFAPTFFISASDCDAMPAEFAPNSPEPRLVARNGTIYGQVFPRQGLAMPDRFIEIHYFHLWTRDCGRAGHPLDV